MTLNVAEGTDNLTWPPRPVTEVRRPGAAARVGRFARRIGLL
jgi:hypothetical protein